MKNKCYPMCAAAILRGNELAPLLCGRILMRDTKNGVWVVAKIYGLPENETGFYGFHIHSAGNCDLPDFVGAKGHYNPLDTPHPLHAGDMPMLMRAKNGQAALSFLTSRFCVGDVVGKAIIIHEGRDDYTSQPSGDAGLRIGCGIIRRENA